MDPNTHRDSSTKKDPLNDVSNRDVPSPHKRRKLEVYCKSRIPARYSKSDHLNKLKRQVDKKEHEINTVNKEILSLKSRKNHLDADGFDLLDVQANLTGELNGILEQLKELQHYENQSLNDLDVKLGLTERKLKLEHDDAVEVEKQNATQEVDSLIEAYIREFENKQNKLNQECQQIQQLVDAHSQGTDELVGQVKGSESERQKEIERSMDEKLVKLQQDLELIENETNNQIQQNKHLKEVELVDAERQESQTKASYEAKQLEFEENAQEIDQLKAKVLSTETTIKSMENGLYDKTNEINSKSEKIMKMKQIIEHNEHERRYLHNRLQELKGNIRVFCRIRPPSRSPSPPGSSDLVSVEYPQSSDDVNEDLNQEITVSQTPDETQTQSRRKSSYTFQFDKVFNPNHKNEQIFQELSQMVQSALDGFNVCVFAYGQTGSGKTWTMSHPQTGMIPLTISKIFTDIEDLKQSHWEYTVEGQFLELYNETIIDLLTNNPGDLKYDIKHDDINNKTTITNLSSVQLTSKAHAISVFEKSSLKRSTASTKSNERSSRSHSIFILNIKGKNTKTGQMSEGALNLIDLAGSERLNNSQAKGERLKETQYINKSLSCLGDVIYALGQSKVGGHIPYRNSKLTYLLKHSLGGDSKTLMFVNISPLAKNFGESINSFRFATKVGQTKQTSNARTRAI